MLTIFGYRGYNLYIDGFVKGYEKKSKDLTELEKVVFWSIIDDEKMVELALRTEFTESYYSYIRKSLLQKLRRAIDEIN